MKDDIISYLKSYKRATITLGELESLVPGNMKYDEFAGCIMELVKDNVLVEKKPEVNNGKDIPLPYKFGINKYELKKDYIDFLQNYSLSISSEIDLQKYFAGSFEELKRDKPYIDKINEYICQKGLPEEYATSQERSFYLVGDEKWIDEKSGRKLLDKIGLWNKLKIMNNCDPLMMAVNPKKLSRSQSEYRHLIVENKATFMALVDMLCDTDFTALIFGSGWKIVSNIGLLERQLGVTGKHKLYYFGDLDNEGISIWNSLNGRRKASVAVKFYSELIRKPCSRGKENQVENHSAVDNFLEFFSTDESRRILDILHSGKYLPQEALKKEELENIWREDCWT